jgi:DNA-directed RNA polymerase omega subunit
MEGISSEGAVSAVGNRYDLVLIASARARELSRGSTALVPSRRGSVVTALKEIEQGRVGREYLKKIQEPVDSSRRRRS